MREIRIIALIPTRAGCAVFLGNDDKVIHFFIDLHIGHSINTAMAGESTHRPLTHDLFSATLKGVGARMTKMIINDCKNETFYSRVFWEMENEVLPSTIVHAVLPSDLSHNSSEDRMSPHRQCLSNSMVHVATTNEDDTSYHFVRCQRCRQRPPPAPVSAEPEEA